MPSELNSEQLFVAVLAPRYLLLGDGTDFYCHSHRNPGVIALHGKTLVDAKLGVMAASKNNCDWEYISLFGFYLIG